eukprot:378555-Pelagomonas_calceolata.AAC.2
MELRAEPEKAKAPAVGRPRASTHLQAPTAEPERLLVLVQLSAHAYSVTLQLLTRIPAINAAVHAREAAGGEQAEGAHLEWQRRTDWGGVAQNVTLGVQGVLDFNAV